MAVRPWENRLVDNNLRDGVMVHEDAPAERNIETKNRFKPLTKKLAVHSSTNNNKQGVLTSNGGGSSSSKSASVLTASSAGLGSQTKSRVSTEKTIVEETNSKPVGVGVRSYGNPKDRPAKPNNEAKKRLSSPNNGELLCIKNAI